MSERSVGTNTRKKLINNEPFAYAHLVKFERPVQPYQMVNTVLMQKDMHTLLMQHTILTLTIKVIILLEVITALKLISQESYLM